MADLRQQMRENLKGRVCLIGLGNPDYGDDGLGVQLAEELIAEGVGGVMVGGRNPEHCISGAGADGYDHMVFVDAVEFGGKPGSVVFLDSAQMKARFPQVSTHKISLSVLAMWVESAGSTRAWLLGVQPVSIKPGGPVSEQVKTTLGVLKQLILEFQGHKGAAPSAGAAPRSRGKQP